LFFFVACIADLSPSHFGACPKQRPDIFIVVCRGLFSIQRFEARGGCSFSWYWWNCWPSQYMFM